MKKLFLTLCVALIAASTLYAQSEDEFDDAIEIGGISYYISPIKKEATVVYCTVDSTVARPEIIIPAKVKYNGKTYPVTEVEYFNRNVFSVTVPSSVKKIGSDVFDGVVNVNYKGKYVINAPWGALFQNKYIDGNLVYSDAAKTILTGVLPGDTRFLQIPDQVKDVHLYCECSFDTVKLGAGTKHLKKWAVGVEWINTLLVSDAVKSIETGAFEGVIGTIVLGTNVQSLGSGWLAEETHTVYSYAKTVPQIKKTPSKPKRKKNRRYESGYYIYDVNLYVPERLANDYNNHEYWHHFRIHCLEDSFDMADYDLAPARAGVREIALIDTLADDAQQQFRLLLDSANQGYAWNQLLVGLEYLCGRIVPADTAQAYEWVAKAAAQNNREALYFMSYFYTDGIGTGPNMKKAFELLTIAATDDEQNPQLYPYSAEALNALGLWYLDGDSEAGVRRDVKKAVQCFRKAALENPAAMYNLGFCYYEGWGVKQDYHKAMMCYKQAAAKDYGRAQAELGHMYFWGLGTLNDLNKAVYWFEKARDNGCSYVEEYLNKAYGEIEDGWEDNRNRRTKIVGRKMYQRITDY